MEPQVKQVFQSLLKSALNDGYYRDVWTQSDKIISRDARPPANKERTSDAHKQITLLHHSDKGECSYIAAKIYEAKHLLEYQGKKNK